MNYLVSVTEPFRFWSVSGMAHSLGMESEPELHDRIVYLLRPIDDESIALISMLNFQGVTVQPIIGGLANLGTLHDRKPGCLMFDMDDVDAKTVFDALPPCRARLPVVVTATSVEIPTVIEAMRLGARDFLVGAFSPTTLSMSLDAVFERLAPITETYHRRQELRAKIDELSDREYEVLDQLLAGNTNKMLAHTLGVSVRTIEMHRANLMLKLGVSNLPQAIRLVFGAIVPLDDDCWAGVGLEASPRVGLGELLCCQPRAGRDRAGHAEGPASMHV
jgi:two-component system response regulator FixJ